MAKEQKEAQDGNDKGGACCAGKKACGGGNAIVVVLVILVVAAVGVLAFMSGKLNAPGMMMAANSQATPNQAAATEQKQPEASTVLAEVNGETVTLGEVMLNFNNLPPQMQQIPQEQLIQIALQQVINNKLVSQKSASAGLENDAEVIEQLENAKKQIIRSKFIGDMIKAEMTDERIKKEYDEYVAGFTAEDQVTASHILVTEEAKAKEIIQKLNNGGDFATLAKENSVDGTAENGGVLGAFTKTDMVPEFADAAFALEVGKYSNAPVKTQFGFHIIKVTEKGKSEPAPYEQIEPYIRQSLNQTILNDYIAVINKEAQIKRYDLQGNEIKQTEPAAGEEGAPASDAAPAEEGKAPAAQ